MAVIIEAAAWLVEHPRDRRTGPSGSASPATRRSAAASTSRSRARSAPSACYTLDGQGADTIDVETFSADLAVVTVRGVNIHPSIAKGRMTNAVRAAADFLARLPRDRLSPETTDGREGFLHPYEIAGGVGEVEAAGPAARLRFGPTGRPGRAAPPGRRRHVAEFPEATIDVAVRPQYRNMAEGLAREPRAVAYAERGAWSGLAADAELAIVRGGTDGSRLTEMGLPTPNLSPASTTPIRRWNGPAWRRWSQAAEWLVALAEVWAEAE